MKKTRNSVVDLYRFIAAVMIMFCHLDLAGSNQYPTFMFVDFFFILSGYFTMAHFAKHNKASNSEERGRTALSYTGKKFLPFLPHLLIAIPIAYLARSATFIYHNDWSGFFSSFKDMFAEILLLPTSFFDSGIRMLGPIWYLAALLVVMPIFSYICQNKKHRPIGMVGLIFAYFFYVLQDSISAFDPVSSVLKCAACMFIGKFIFDVVAELKNVKLRKWTKVALTVIEIACLTYVICAGFFWFTPLKMQVIAYIIMLTITLSGQSYSSKINCGFFTLLGQISMPLFIWHYAVGRIILHLVRGVSPNGCIVLFFVGSFAAAFASYFVVEACKKRGLTARKIFLRS